MVFNGTETDFLQRVLPCLSDRCSKRCRAKAYQLIRLALVDSETILQLDRKVDWYLIKSVHLPLYGA